MHDTDKDPSPSEQPNQPVQLVTTPMGYQHPVGFEAAAFFIVGMTKEGKIFVNMPIDQPHLALHLATQGLLQASQLAVMSMQAKLQQRSPILAPPPGLTIPPWMAGRS